jgi:hypothetical protein
MEHASSESLTFGPSRVKWIAIGVLMAALATGAIGLLVTATFDPGARWLVGGMALLFAAGAVASAMSLQPGRVYLRLTREGFATKALFGRERAFRWIDTEPFESRFVKGNTWVVFSLSNAAPPQGALRRSNRLLGFGENLPDTYGMRGDQLAALMNEWRTRHLQ